MTDLIINGVRAVLSNDFAVTVKQENAIYTKNGEYTYDCTMSLLNPINAKLYGFLQRINKTEAFATDRRVILIADNRVYCDGTEVIQKWTNEKVTIQIVSGNSQLNYFIGSDKKVSELDLGKATIDDTTKVSSLTQFDTLGYAFPPIKIGDVIYNQYAFDVVKDGTSWWSLKPKSDSEWRAMPYYVTLIEKIITALGYTINTDTLRDLDYAHMILIHNVDTDEFAKMLPGWTCKEFLEQMENLFNIVFYIGYKTKKVDIITQAKFYGTAGMAHVKNIKDAYETEIDSDATDDDHTTANIGYDLTETTYYKLRRLPDEIKSMATKLSMTEAAAETYFAGNTDTGMELVTDPSSGKQYIRVASDDGKSQVPEEVNEYKNLIRDENDTDLGITLSIIPVKTETLKLNEVSEGEVDIYVVKYNVPSIDESSSTTTETQTNLYDWIANGGYETSDSKDTLNAAFFAGCIYYPKVTYNGNKVIYPQVYMDGAENVVDASNKLNTHSASFRLEKIASEFYSSSYKIDKKNKLTIESYDPNIYDVRLLFEVQNKRYICEYIEYSIDSTGRKGTWKGIFHPVKVSDTDAEHLWILADKKWRDNGVFLDNGRWAE